MLPDNLIDNHAVQILLGLILFGWDIWLSKVIIAHGNTITELHTILTNHHHTLPDRMAEVERRLGITPPESK